MLFDLGGKTVVVQDSRSGWLDVAIGCLQLDVNPPGLSVPA